MPFVHISRWLLGSIVVAILGLGGSMLISPKVDMRIEPQSGTQLVGKTFETKIVVSSETPVNVFKGVMHFDPSILMIETIDYNTSIADLWAERPWYQNGEGTLNFIGGTTRHGGFIGTGQIITVRFRTLQEGTATINLDEVRILKHDGLGSDVPVSTPIDAIFTIENTTLEEQTVFQKSVVGPTLYVVSTRPKTDLNQDGQQTIVDISIFMQDLLTQNLRSDFNNDQSVNAADLSIILDAK